MEPFPSFSATTLTRPIPHDRRHTRNPVRFSRLLVSTKHSGPWRPRWASASVQTTRLPG